MNTVMFQDVENHQFRLIATFTCLECIFSIGQKIKNISTKKNSPSLFRIRLLNFVLPQKNIYAFAPEERNHSAYGQIY